MREERKIPFKNYIILSIILLLTIVLVVYFYMWYSEFERKSINTPILNEYFSVVNYNELDNYLVENENVVLYISASSVEVRRFEKNFKNIINKYSLNNILYLDLTQEKKNESLYKSIVSKYKLLDLPCIVVFKGGNVYDVYSVEDNDYDINKLIDYLKFVGVIYD